MATATSAVPAGGGRVTRALEVARPVTVCHLLITKLERGGVTLDLRQLRFTMTVPYPYNDFTALLWSTASTSPVLLHTDRLCYEWGADMCDPSNTLRDDDDQAALQYALRARSGLRMVPYVTRIFADTPVNNGRQPCLSDPGYLRQWDNWLTIQGRQAAPYQPAAYTLGDENRLFRGRGEVGHQPAAVAAFRRWLARKYRTVAALNREWQTRYRSFAAIDPMLLGQVLQRLDNGSTSTSLAPWIDHEVFLDDCFADTHDHFRDVLRRQDPGAKVGWDGLLNYGWKSGYDFTKLTAHCDLNETYLHQWLQVRLVADFKKPGALTGSWGNRVADNEAGWHAFPWACLLQGENSVWWWTSWGCDYVPFYPDLSQSRYGKWFFEAVRETSDGPGRLLLHAHRVASPVALLYAKRNMFAGVIAGKRLKGEPWAGDNGFRKEHEAILHALVDLGYDPTHVSEAQLARGLDPAEIRVLILPLTTCLSDADADAIRAYVRAGGTLVVDGRAGILTEHGAFREKRPLDDVLGVTSPTGPAAFLAAGPLAQVTAKGTIAGQVSNVPLSLAATPVRVLEPGLKVTTGRPLARAGKTPLLIVNRFGRGTAVTLNLAMVAYDSVRTRHRPKPRLDILDAVLRGAGVAPLSVISLRGGGRPLATSQSGFRDGKALYLGIEQDILAPGLADQAATIRLRYPAIVYDVRRGERVGRGRIREWNIVLSRGYPLLYALLPYEVKSVALTVPAAAARGRNTRVSATVTAVSGTPGYHVVRVDVYAPGSTRPHRQYSQNMDCPAGHGTITIPFALNDPPGPWRLVARDVASGRTTQAVLNLR